MNSYKDDEIVDMLKQLFEMDITKRDISQCKPEFVQKFYSLFLKDFGVSIEKLNQLPMNAPETMHQYSEMYKSQIFQIQLAKCVKHYLNLIYGYTGLEFSMVDIFSPEWSRTKKFFIMLIEFYNHLSDNFPEFNQVDEEVAMKREKLEVLKESISSFKRKIGQKEMQNAQAEIEVEKVKRSLALEQEEIRKAQEVKTRYKGRLEGLKDEIQELVTKLKVEELHILEGNDRIDQLRSQVIDESQNLEFEESKKKLTMYKENIEEMKNALQEMRQTLKVQEEAEEFIDKSLLPAIKEYKAEVKKNENVETQLKEYNKEAASLTDSLNDLRRTCQDILESNKTSGEEIVQWKRKKEVRISGLKEEVNQLKISLKDIRRTNEEKDIVSADINLELQKVMEEDLKLSEEMDHFLTALQASLERMNAMFLKFCKTDLENLKNAKLGIP